MPSVIRPSWLGVSTPKEQSTMSHLTEGLSQLERSTALLQRNLSNYLSNNISQRDETIIEIPPEATLDNEIPDSDTLTQEVGQILKKNDDLKSRVQEVLEANAEFKNALRKYMEDNAQWKEEFVEETRKIEMELQAVMVRGICHFERSEEDRGSRGFGCGIKEKIRIWYSAAGLYGRNTLMNLKAKLNELHIADAIVPNMRPNLYTPTSYFDMTLLY